MNRIFAPFLLCALWVATGHPGRADSSGQATPLTASAKSDKPPSKADSEAQRKAAKDYYVAKLHDRHGFVHGGAKLKPEMAEFYRGGRPQTVEEAAVTEVVQLRDGVALALVSVKGTVGGRRAVTSVGCYVSKRNGAWLVDWHATIGHNPTPVKTYRAAASTDAATFRVSAEISDYYNYQFSCSKPTHHSVRLVDANGDSIHGYAKKATDVGRAIYGLVKDGKPHKIAVSVRSDGAEGSVVEILRVVSKDWVTD